MKVLGVSYLRGDVVSETHGVWALGVFPSLPRRKAGGKNVPDKAWQAAGPLTQEEGRGYMLGPPIWCCRRDRPHYRKRLPAVGWAPRAPLGKPAFSSIASPPSLPRETESKGD